MFVLPTPWQVNLQDLLDDCLAALEMGKGLDVRHRF
jgi:hypothetical protein